MIPRIMIVDDEENFATTLAERLKMRDYDVHTCFSGDQAIEAIRQRHIDVVILDVAMPGKNGIETLREIKKIKPLTEVLMLTGQATVESAIEGMKLGAHDYLMKPCDTEELVKKINDCFDKKKAQEEKITEAKMKELISSPHAVFRKK
jgi:DNA-binding NtrC family response regulator